MTDLEQELFGIITQIETTKTEEESYRWDNIGSYPNTKIPTEVRDKWIADLRVISDKQYAARKAAQAIIKRLSSKGD